MGKIEYKTKVRQIRESDDTLSDYIDYKRVLTRRDCDLKPRQHTYYNCDMFPSMLNRAHKTATNGREWCRLRDLPECVKIDTSKFLAVVTIELPDNFR